MVSLNGSTIFIVNLRGKAHYLYQRGFSAHFSGFNL